MRKYIFLTFFILVSVCAHTFAHGQAPNMDSDSPSSHLKGQQRIPSISADPLEEKNNYLKDATGVIDFDNLEPFGSNLFSGRFKDTYYDEINPEYIIMPGDRVGVRIWGAFEFDQVLVVDSLGNIFIPTIGPINIGGKTNSSLQQTINSEIKSVYTRDFESYITLLNTQPTAVYVTGFVNNPGRYAGGYTESVLYYLDQAGGIDLERGSFRDVRIIRDGEILATLDIYEFILCGNLALPRLKEGDVIMVPRKGISIAVSGSVRNRAWFEFSDSAAKGEDLIALVSALPDASHVSIEGSRHGAPFYKFLSRDKFQEFVLEDSDKVVFFQDVPAESIPVQAQGALDGSSRYLVKKGARLKDILAYIQVKENLANLDGIHIKRKSVAERQKQALDSALQRLEQNALTASSASVDESTIRVKEAELIQDFVQRAGQIEPDGVVVISSSGRLNNILLEKDDIIVIPEKDDIVMVSGEVVMPHAIVFDQDKSLQDYIDGAGGFSNRADAQNILVVKPNGKIIPHNQARISNGDHIMVLPRYDSKNLQLAKDISQILYQIAIATKVAFTSW